MLTEFMRDTALWGIDHGRYLGTFILSALGSMIVPVPNELVMPPLGMRIATPSPDTGFQATWILALLASSLGSLTGSLLSYYLGYFGGKPLVMKVGRFLLINEHHLDLTSSWFKRWGSLTVFISRFLPIVRHFISIPAGIAKMNLLKFSLYTLLGAAIYNGFLLYVGFKLEAHWTDILAYRKVVDAVIGIGLVILIALWFYLHLRKPKKPAEPHPEG